MLLLICLCYRFFFDHRLLFLRFLLLGQPLCGKAGFLCLGLRRIAPRDVPLQMAEQMKPRRLKLRADHSQPQQPCPERIPVIGRARRRRTGIALRQRLIGDGKAELYVRLHFSRMQRGIEHSELHRAFLEHGMKVQGIMLSST